MQASIKAIRTTVGKSILPMLLIVVLCVVFYSMNVRFLSYANFGNLLRQSAVLLVVATGLTFVVIMGSIDLSIGAIVTLSAIVCAVMIKSLGIGVGLSLLIACLVGGGCGLLNGVLVIYARIPSFVATLGTMTALTGLSTWISGGTNVFFNQPTLRWLSNGMIVHGLPNVALWALIISLIAAFVGLRTPLGRALYATGASAPTAWLSGFNVIGLRLSAFVISGVLCGLGGLMMVARTSSGTARMGDGLMRDAIAAVVIGGTALSGGGGGAHRTLLGVLAISIIKNGLNVVGVDPYSQIVVSGLLVIVAVALILDRTTLAFVK